MRDVRTVNREAWNRQVDTANRWTIAVTPEEVEEARAGRVLILLTPTIPVPAAWLGTLRGADVLCLASGGGQQGPILAAAGATVTVYDNSPRQLAQDRLVAEREGLSILTVEGDMRDLACFAGAAFDLIVHPVSNVFVPDVRPVWREAYRVLRPGGALLAGFDNPLAHMFDWPAYEQGELIVRHPIPYSDLEALTEAQLEAYANEGTPLEFGHTLDDQIGGQLDAGFLLAGFYEDRCPPEDADPLSAYIATFMATRALKPGRAGAAR